MLAELTERLANATSIEANASLDDIWVTLTAAWPTEGFAVKAAPVLDFSAFPKSSQIGISSLSFSFSRLAKRQAYDS